MKARTPHLLGYVLVFALLSLLLLVPAHPAEAQYGYGGYYNFAPSYPYYGCQQPCYQPPAHAPYQKVYPAQKVVAQEIAVAPLIVTVPVESKAVPVHAFGSPYYYSASDAYREKAYLRQVLREELRGLLNGDNKSSGYGQGGGGYNAQQPQRPGQPPAQAPQQPQAQNAAPVPDDRTPPELQQKVLAAFEGKGSCVSCHGQNADKLGKGFKLVLDDGKGGSALAKQSSDKRWKIYGMASVGAMPPAAASDASKAMEASHLPVLLQYASQKD